MKKEREIREKLKRWEHYLISRRKGTREIEMASHGPCPDQRSRVAAWDPAPVAPDHVGAQIGWRARRPAASDTLYGVSRILAIKFRVASLNKFTHSSLP
jgi:hypothetical protein